MDDSQILDELRARTEALMEKMGRARHLFTIEADACVLVVIDMQNFACRSGGDSPFIGLEGTIDNIDSLAGRCRELAIPVVWIRHAFDAGPTGNDAGLYPRFHGGRLDPDLLRTSSGTELYEALAVDSADPVVFKNRYSCFSPGASELPQLLEDLQRRHLLVTGLAANVCVESTIRDAMQLDYPVTLVSDATATFDEIFKEISLANVRLFFGDVKTTEEVLGELDCS
jgi:ureidoacrylate peracid hydrolase